jgi:Prokaryotic E2 family E
MRRAFQLGEEDLECLNALGLGWEAVIENSAKWIILPEYPIPDGYTCRIANAALRIPPLYPDEQIDMVYFCPSLALVSSRTIANLTPFPLDGKPYQQWSRHRTSENPWRPGVDTICTHLLQVNDWLNREIK